MILLVSRLCFCGEFAGCFVRQASRFWGSRSHINIINYILVLHMDIQLSMYNPCPKVLVKARFEPIERHHLNAAIPPNLLNNSITTLRSGLELKTEIKEIMENQKLRSKKKHKNELM